MRTTFQDEPNVKRYYRMREASKIVGVEPYLIRFWLSELGFESQVKKKNDRLFTLPQVEKLKEILRLSRVEGYKLWRVKELIKNF